MASGAPARPVWRRTLRVTLAVLPAAMTVTALWAVLHTAPLARPFVERGTDDLRVALERSLRWHATPDFILPRIDAALAADDPIALAPLAAFAQEHAIDLGPDRAARVAKTLQPPSGAMACAACAWDIATCRGLAQIAACALPLELTPLGDANALRRNAGRWLQDGEIDRFETALAAIGLGATGVAVLSAGTAAPVAAPVKAGATALRVSRRIGGLTPEFATALGRLLPPPAALGDAAALRPLRAVLGDLGRIVGATSLPDALVLLRHVDSPQDAARMARVAEAAGPRTRQTVEVLGGRRALRATLRISDRAASALALIWLGTVQAATMLASLAGRTLVRPALRWALRAI